MSNESIPLVDLKTQYQGIKEEIDSAIQRVLDSQQFILGPEVSIFEKEISKYCNSKHAIGVSSGTDALLIPLFDREIEPGDAALTTTITSIATAEVIKLIGAMPIFVDIDPETFNMNLDLIPDAVNEAKKKGLNPKAIIPVDLFGLPAQYDVIEKFARENDLFLLEDAAQGFGGEIGGRKAGSFGDVAATSFFPAKPLGCYGDGGAIFTNDGDLAEVMKSIRIHGGGSDKYDNVRVGINGRLDTIQAAVLLEKLAIFPDEVAERNKVAQYYSDNMPVGFVVPHIPENYLSSWAQYSILAESKQKRDSAIELLESHGIPTMIYYRIPLHLQKVFSDLGFRDGDFPVSENAANYIFSIPMHPYLRREQRDRIIDVLGQQS